MGAEDWYRNKIWNSEIKENFETRLKRSRGAFHKAQYLRVQASYLLDSKNNEYQNVGVRLMERMINDYPEEKSSTIFGQEQLGDYYLKTYDFDNAEKYYKIVIEHYKSRSGTSIKADLKLAETYLTANKVEKFVEAYKIGKKFPNKELTFNSDKFYFTELMAHICDKLGKQDEAKEYAKTAIELSKITEPQFYRHKTVGLVRVTEQQLRTLEQIVNE